MYYSLIKENRFNTIQYKRREEEWTFCDYDGPLSSTTGSTQNRRPIEGMKDLRLDLHLHHSECWGPNAKN